MHVVYVQVNDKDRMYLNVLIKVQDLFHVYLNKCEFQFLHLHINKTNTFCFLINNGRVTGKTKWSK